MSLWNIKHYFLSPFHKVRQPSELEVQFMLKWGQPWEREGANLPSRRTQDTIGIKGGAENYDDNDDDDDDDFNDDDDD